MQYETLFNYKIAGGQPGGHRVCYGFCLLWFYGFLLVLGGVFRLRGGGGKRKPAGADDDDYGSKSRRILEHMGTF